MQSIAEYNGVRLFDVQTESIDFTPEKDSSGVDQVGVRVTGVFTCVLHCAGTEKTGKKIASQNSNGLAEGFAAALASTLARLSKDRRRFTWKIGQKTALDIVPLAVEPGAKSYPVATLPAGLLGDIHHGPVPSVQVIKVTSGVSAHIRFTITAIIPNCDSQGRLDPSGLVNFRYAVHEDVDCTTWLLRRTYQGRLRVASKDVSPHALRNISIPPLEDGFQRRVIQWNESLDGLHLDFTIVDQEQVASAPWNVFANTGATDWSGTLSMSSNSFGLTGTSELNFTLIGPKSVSKLDLMDIAFRICQAKSRLFDFQPGGVNAGQGFMEYFNLAETLHANEVTAQCRIMHTGGASPGAGVGLLTLGKNRVIGQPLSADPIMAAIGYDPDRHFQPELTAGVGGIFLSLLQLPCEPGSMPNQQANQVQKPPRKRLARQRGRQSNSFLQESKSDASQSHLQSMYLEYLLDSEIFTDNGAVCLPTGAARDSKAPSAAVINLYRPYSIREIRIDASRINKNPEIPIPGKKFFDFNQIEYTAIGDAQVSALAPQISADNRKLLYRTRVQMRYSMSRPPRDGETLPVGCVPYRVASLSDPSRRIAAESFVRPESILT